MTLWDATKPNPSELWFIFLPNGVPVAVAVVTDLQPMWGAAWKRDPCRAFAAGGHVLVPPHRNLSSRVLRPKFNPRLPCTSWRTLNNKKQLDSPPPVQYHSSLDVTFATLQSIRGWTAPVAILSYGSGPLTAHPGPGY